MKAAQITKYGDSSVLEVKEVEKPEVSEGKVLVEVRAVSLNPFDTMVRMGYLKDNIPLELPVTIGGDIAGVVAEVGAGVTNVAVGDKIYGQANVVAGNSGAFAEFAATSAGQVTKAPANIDEKEAASLPLVGASALQALDEHIKLQAEQKILITGGGGGIGSVAVQIAKNKGAYVVTTATGDDIAHVKELGADEVIDYKAEDATGKLSDFDAVFDTVGKDFTDTLAVLKKGGVAVSMIAEADAAKAQELGVTAFTQSTQVTTEVLDSLRALVEQGVVKPNVGKVFPLAEVKEAFDARESGSINGKIVLAIK